MTATVEEPAMPGKIKLILTWLVFGFLVYAVITSPERAADIVRAVWDIVLTGFQNIGRFFESLLG
ncbi:hypothetical protein [Ornithinicoccus halotolerans]|uniref:hypothetical protein n=1 Tax=Ornithinicoccus halotolerans TaxID=1748220 RepID=UPI001296A379|nr:hypothetical protein [Ornithinicoccus halotolerans]